jgi:hypothetical protein
VILQWSAASLLPPGGYNTCPVLPQARNPSNSNPQRSGEMANDPGHAGAIVSDMSTADSQFPELASEHSTI